VHLFFAAPPAVRLLAKTNAVTTLLMVLAVTQIVIKSPPLKLRTAAKQVPPAMNILLITQPLSPNHFVATPV